MMFDMLPTSEYFDQISPLTEKQADKILLRIENNTFQSHHKQEREKGKPVWRVFFSSLCRPIG